MFTEERTRRKCFEGKENIGSDGNGERGDAWHTSLAKASEE